MWHKLDATSVAQLDATTTALTKNPAMLVFNASVQILRSANKSDLPVGFLAGLVERTLCDLNVAGADSIQNIHSPLNQFSKEAPKVRCVVLNNHEAFCTVAAALHEQQ